MINKNEIKAALKDKLGSNFSGQPSFRPSKVPGYFGMIAGGSFGPMTVTNAYLDANERTEEKVKRILDDLDAIDYVGFQWIEAPTYKPSEGYDPTYTTYWLHLKWKNVKESHDSINESLNNEYFEYADSVEEILVSSTNTVFSAATLDEFTNLSLDMYESYPENDKDDYVPRIIKIIQRDIPSRDKARRIAYVLYNKLNKLYADDLRECTMSGAFGSMTPENIVKITNVGLPEIATVMKTKKKRTSNCGYQYADQKDFVQND